jgi:histidine triad (HIT) family protein
LNDDCVFCRIAAGEIPSREAYQGNLVYGFYDQQPVAPVHVLLVPRHHVTSAAELGPEHGDVLAEMAVAAQAVAEREGIGDDGYRLVFNVGDAAGATVPHLHMHMLGGRQMGWPPG